MDRKHICEALQNTGKVRIAVFGDFCLDKYLYIDPARDEPSVETGLTAYQVHAKRMSAGAGGTITNNLRALGVQTTCVGLVGNDGEGFELLRALEEVGADTAYMIRSDDICTCTYTKPMRKDETGQYREMNRLDFRYFTPISRELEDKLLANLRAVLDTVDAVIVIDQYCERNAAAVTDRIRSGVSALAAERTDKIFYVDSRAFISDFQNMIVKCNNLELAALVNAPTGSEDMDFILRAGKELQQSLGRPAYITRGAEGLLAFEEGGVTMVPAYPVTGEIDICGAGDATSAGLVTGLSLGLTGAEAAAVACCVSSITIQQLGCTGTASVEEVCERLQSIPAFYQL